MQERLANEIMDAANNTGAAVKEKKICIRWLTLIGIRSLQMVKYLS